MPVQVVNVESVSRVPLVGTLSIAVITKDVFKKNLDNDIVNVFLNTLEFGEVATYLYENGETVQIKIIFDDESRNLAMAGLMGQAIMDVPIITAASEQFLYETGNKDKVKIRNRWYNVTTIHPDGTGITMFELKNN